MKELPVSLVDVFAADPFQGNPVAVVSAAGDLSTVAMQRITRWLNLSETTFLLPPTRPDADYRVRIFTLAHELPFAGHPTLGTAHVWLESGGRPRLHDHVVQECEAGLVPIRRCDHGLAFAAPPLLRSGLPTETEIQEVADVLRTPRSRIVKAAWADNGPGWIAVMLSTAEEVLALEPVRHHATRIDIGVVGAHDGLSDADFELRAFFSDGQGGMIEDPVTGSLNASIGQWLFAEGNANASYVAAQGTRLGRRGRIRVEQDAAGQVWVAGNTRTLLSGHRVGW